MAANIKFKRTSGSGLPTGLTFAEPAFVLGSAGTTTANQLYVGDNSGGRVWVGAKIENTVTNWTGTEANTLLATQQAIDARITSRITSSGGFTFQGSAGTAQTITPGDIVTFAAGSGISTTGSATDTITIANTGVTGVQGGTAISVSSATGFPTITNTGVQSLTITSGSGIQAATVSGTTGAITYTITNTGVTGIQPGTGISVTSNTGNPTITNVGVTGLTGTANQITVSGTTGSITLSLPSAITTPGSLTVTGNLTVNGTTTTVNSTTVTVQDPIIAIGGLTGNIAPVSGDTKDRGILAQYRNAADTGGLTGFFGIDQSTGYFTFVPNATVASEVVSGTPGTISVSTVSGPVAGYAKLDLSGTDDTFTLSGGSTNSKLLFTEAVAGRTGSLTVSSLSASRTYTLPDATGTVLVYGASGNTNQITTVGTVTSGTWNGATLGLAYGGTNKSITAVNGGIVWTDADSMEVSAAGTSGNILKSNGAAAPTWLDPTASGFTAYAATNVAGGAQGSLHYQTAANTTGMLSLGTANYLLTAGATAPQWTNPAASGFTAYAATNASNIVTAEASGTYYLAMASAINSTGTGLFLDTTATALTYVTSTGTLTCTAVDALIDGGAY